MPTKSERAAIEAEKATAAHNPNETDFDRTERSRKDRAALRPPTKDEYAHMDPEARALWVLDGKTDKYVPKPPPALEPAQFARTLNTVATTCAARIDAVLSELTDKGNVGVAVAALKAETAFLRTLGRDHVNPFPAKDGAKEPTSPVAGAARDRQADIDRSRADRESKRAT